jgi:hypothetical protein
MPWGDGIVDVEDLQVLAKHLFEEPRLAACWRLDETAGDTTLESVSGIDSFVIGIPSWRPDQGMVDGAIELDGIDDYVMYTLAVLDPADGPFSVYAWMKGGGPGQVIVSQQTISDWLLLDDEGKLMTDIKCELDLTGPLLSDTVVTDGQWHHVGLAWDGSNRKLIVDGVTVAEDRQIGPGSSDRGMSIGVGKDFATGTFFSGLIDDVRIYNRVVYR